VKFRYITKDGTEYLVDGEKDPKTGKVICNRVPWRRINPKVKMSKKQRRKLRKETKDRLLQIAENEGALK
jgi:hypothetical protein